MLNTNLGLNGINTPAVGTNFVNPLSTFNMNSSIFGNNLQGNITNYENDFLMPEFLKFNNCMTMQYSTPAQNPAQATQTQQANPYQQVDYTQVQNPSFQGQAQGAQYSEQELQNYIAQQGETPEQAPSLGLKKKGLIVGLAAPVATGLYSALKSGASLAGVFSKSTLLKCPIYGALGFLAGTLIENLFCKKS